jgi:adenylate cyclase
MPRRLQNLLAVVLAGLWGAFIWSAHARGHLAFLDRVEAAVTDFGTILRGVKPPPDSVTIVEIDDALVKQAGGFPLPRPELGRVVQAIARLKPRVIALDILLLDKGSDEGDDAVAGALGAGPAVIAGAALFPESRQSIDVENREDPIAGLPRAERFLLPLKKFSDHAQIGIVNLGTDRSGTPRSMPMLFRTNDSVEMSLPLRVAALATASNPTIEPHRLILGQLSIPTDSDRAAPIVFYGPRRTIRTISARALLAGEADPAAIENKIVVLGTTVTGGGDFFSTPFEAVMPGVEVVSTAIAQLVSGDVVRRDRSVRIVDGLTTVILPMILVGTLAWRRSTAGILAAAAVGLGWASAVWIAFSLGVWLVAVLPVAATAPPAVLFGAFQLWSGRRQAQYFAMKSRLLGEFQAPDIQEWLTRNPHFLAEPVSQNAAIIFIDLSGFTSLSEGYEPQHVQELLKGFHALVDHEVVSNRGTVTSFQGDGAMILFGLPGAAPDDARRAADCAVGLCVATRQWLTSLPVTTASKLGFKVGAHFGVIVASRLGGESHHHITATGDTVNVASRLMEIAAHHGVQLAVGDELLRAAGADCALLKTGRLYGPHETPIRGRSATLTTWLWNGTSVP